MKQKIQVRSYPDGDEDCYRLTYYTLVDGKEKMLAPCALGLNEHIRAEITANVQKLFGADAEWEMANDYAGA